MALDVKAWLGAVEVPNELGNPIRISDRVVEALGKVAQDGTLSDDHVDG